MIDRSSRTVRLTSRASAVSGVFATREKLRQAERALADQAEASYKRSVADWQATKPKNKAGASVTAGRA